MGEARSCVDEDAIWDAYNLLLGGPDTERLRKMLVRAELFASVVDVPGDVVEAGVLKGTGLLFWLKLLAIRTPGSIARVVGFDLFEGWSEQAADADKEVVDAYLAEAGFSGITPEAIAAKVEAAGFAGRCELVAGDVCETAPAYVEAHPGFRIRLLNLDMDVGAPTKAALEALWPRVSRGGVVVFDEYAVSHWSASEGIDAWLETQPGLRVRTIPWGRSPTAFVVKP